MTTRTNRWKELEERWRYRLGHGALGQESRAVLLQCIREMVDCRAANLLTGLASIAEEDAARELTEHGSVVALNRLAPSPATAEPTREGEPEVCLLCLKIREEHGTPPHDFMTNQIQAPAEEEKGEACPACGGDGVTESCPTCQRPGETFYTAGRSPPSGRTTT